jgi:hypothetical protein
LGGIAHPNQTLQKEKGREKKKKKRGKRERERKRGRRDMPATTAIAPIYLEQKLDRQTIFPEKISLFTKQTNKGHLQLRELSLTVVGW